MFSTAVASFTKPFVVSPVLHHQMLLHTLPIVFAYILPVAILRSHLGFFIEVQMFPPVRVILLG